jgi:hypothetical protein
MQTVLSDTSLSTRKELLTELVDMFFRINKHNDKTIKFEDLTSYLIDHEIAFDADLGTNGGFNASNSNGLNMAYYESTIKDPTTHNNYIERIYYFEAIDRLMLYEQNMKNIRIYEGNTLKHEKDIQCSGVILAVEYIQDKNSICVSLSDRTFVFYDAGNVNYKLDRKFNLPSTQKCLCYVPRKRTLFSAGTDGAVFAWLIDKIFCNDYLEEQLALKTEKKEMEYRNYICENTPWFLGAIASCIIDLPNIE